ncbi:HAMP domain-containing sensor histidine kinase [Actinophytocola glycyrrhizae]|uniref:histidine kinase n=1 Tax=Actinophytocola glycyrrhizae TaxID=2044873 RepID=A0ABV9S4M0_9PSEU
MSLQRRVMLTFAAGAALVSLVLALSVYTVTRTYLTDQREQSVTRQANADAAFVDSRLRAPHAVPRTILEDLDPPTGTMALLRVDGRWHASEPGIGQDILPAELWPAGDVGFGTAAPVDIAGEPYLAVRHTLDAEVDFYEVAPLRELRSTLDVVHRVLVVCAVVATLGAALVGFWASRRLLRPLHQLASTAVQVADGDLDTRVPASRDRELTLIGDSVNRMVDSLQERIERERRFFGDVSHELRTPLTTLVTAVGVLNRYRDALPGRGDQALDLVETEVNHLHRLLEHLLALARAEAGLHQDEPETVSLGELLRNVLTDSGRPAELLTVRADTVVRGRKLALERAFVNLVDNADRHGGGLTGVTTGSDGARAVVFIDDSGPGVPEADRETIFERFTTGRSGRGATAGTGLGLALVAETLVAHGGDVRCVDRPGGGARMVVTLPAVAAEQDPP